MATPDQREQEWEPPVSSAEIDLYARRELAVRALDAVMEILDEDVTVDKLLQIAREVEPSRARLMAKRVLRALTSIGRPEDPVIQTIGEVGIYDYVEGVVTYGAAEWRFMDLMRDHNLSPAQATAIYEVRRQIREYTHDRDVALDEVIKALRGIGIDPSEDLFDPETAVASLDEAGCFVGYRRGQVFDRPAFIPKMRGRPIPGHHIDSVRGDGSSAWVRERIETGRMAVELEESEE